jgi:para-aminobenzoate synthetase
MIERSFWLDGGGSQPWSGTRSLRATLAADDVSLTYDRQSGVVHRHRSGGVEDVPGDIFAVLEEEIASDAGDPHVHWVGYFGYAARPDLPARTVERLPDAVWMRVRDPEIDEQPARTPMPPRREHDADAAPPLWYREAFDAVQEQLRGGYSYEVNLTYRESMHAHSEPEQVYARLRRGSPAPYAGYLRHGDLALLSASPERFATVDRDRRVETKPIKGTTPSGATPEADDALRAQLAADARYRSENLMIVDLLRNDLATVSVPGTVVVPELMQVESYATVHQLVSTVQGQLLPEMSTVRALRALFPAGSMTGAPKLSTMRIIDAVETTPRGAYSGAFGWICADGRADLGVVIRSLTATREQPGWRYTYGTGGGITVYADAESEYAETRWKAEHLRRAVSGDAI